MILRRMLILVLKVTQLVINVNDDAALYDNAGTNVNTASPGAERYQINLELTTRADVTDNDTFVFIGRIENGKVVEEVETNDSYNKINDLLATRTEEESAITSSIHSQLILIQKMQTTFR